MREEVHGSAPSSLSSDRGLIMGLPYLLWMVLSLLMLTSEAGLKLDLHLALSQGSPLPQQEGAYLQDSFRQKVLIPAFEELNTEMESLKLELDQLGMKLTILETMNTMLFIVVAILMFIMRNSNMKNRSKIEKLNNPPGN